VGCAPTLPTPKEKKMKKPVIHMWGFSAGPYRGYPSGKAYCSVRTACGRVVDIHNTVCRKEPRKVTCKRCKLSIKYLEPVAERL